MKKKFLLILIIPSLLFSQTKDELDLCIAIQGNSFSSNTAAENALNRILNTIGASKNFVLSPCDKINNAVATAYKGTRYILYDNEFMNLINRNTNDWSNLFVLAHEVGHHINGHSIDILLYTSDIVEPKSLAKKRQQELEADEFAAFVLAKLGASLSQLNSIVSLISDNSDDTYSTHPKRSKRLASVRNGFNKGYVKKETRTVIISNATSKYEKKKNFIRYGQWYKGKSNDPFEEGIYQGSIVSGKVISNANTDGLKAPLFGACVTKYYSGGITGDDDGFGFNYFFIGLGKWLPSKLVNEKVNLEITASIRILNRNGDEIDSGILTGYTNGPLDYQREHIQLFFETDNDAVTMSRSMYVRYELLPTNFKKGNKILVKFKVSVPNKEYSKQFDIIQVPLLNDSYFEYSLSGSSKALSF